MRFRGAVRADLLDHYGVDLAEYWQQRRYLALLELIDNLPVNSRYVDALLNDPDTADELMAAEARQAEGPGQQWTPPLSRFGIQEMLLSDLLDRMADLVQAVFSTIPVEKGKSRPRYNVPPAPRPRTALDDARRSAQVSAGEFLLAAFFPSHAAGNHTTQ